MKRLLLILCIITLIIGVLSLLFSALNLFGYYNVLDGTPELYSHLHLRMIGFLVIGIVACRNLYEYIRKTESE